MSDHVTVSSCCVAWGIMQASCSASVAPCGCACHTQAAPPETRPCRSCARPIATRYNFTVCVRCSLDALERDPSITSWREAKRIRAVLDATDERCAEAGLVKL